MRKTFIQFEAFAAKWKRLKLTDEDLQALEEQLAENPEAGDVMSGTGGLRKVRFAPPSWHMGKSGATRVCYVHIVRADAVGLMTLFSKSEKPNLSPADRVEAARLVKIFRDSFPKDLDDEKNTGKAEGWRANKRGGS